MQKTLLSLTGFSFVLAATFALPSAQSARAAAPQLTDRDRADIQELVTHYAKALSTCAAEDYADLFAPVTGSFASGFRGELVGREKLIALVQSEPHCATTTPGRAFSGNGPTVSELQASAEGVTGRVNLGKAGHYDDVYVKTPKGWRFQSRNVITPQEEAANFTGKDFIAIRRLAGESLGNFADVYRDMPVGRRLRNAGVVIAVTPEGATGKAVLRNDGGRYDDVYVRTADGWRFKSRTYVPPADAPRAQASAGQ
ncbi:MAG TPA: nuclear transport factor 2 family protein [Vicinamibacterales bacterium]|nr:nuclear transport factor 2 family protein [Vicinamibacterales bacterium]